MGMKKKQLIKHGRFFFFFFLRLFCPSLPSIVHNRGVVIRSVEIICVLLFEVEGKIWLQKKKDKVNQNQIISV